MQSLDIDNIELPVFVVLYQTGYLTIKEAITVRGERYYQLRMPNFEVQKSFNEEILNTVTPSVIKKQKCKIICILHWKRQTLKRLKSSYTCFCKYSLS